MSCRNLCTNRSIKTVYHCKIKCSGDYTVVLVFTIFVFGCSFCHVSSFYSTNTVNSIGSGIVCTVCVCIFKSSTCTIKAQRNSCTYCKSVNRVCNYCNAVSVKYIRECPAFKSHDVAVCCTNAVPVPKTECCVSAKLVLVFLTGNNLYLFNRLYPDKCIVTKTNSATVCKHIYSKTYVFCRTAYTNTCSWCGPPP